MNERQCWIVSPNVKHRSKTAPGWIEISRRLHAAFMGYGPNRTDHILGRKFAGEQPPHIPGVLPNDIILIARRHNWRPQIVGLGVVRGEFERMTFNNLSSETVTVRNLNPFKSLDKPPPGVPLIEVLQHPQALIQLHPKIRIHRRVCEWMEGQIADRDKPSAKEEKDVQSSLADLPKLGRPWFIVRKVRQNIKAEKKEAKLVENYKQALSEFGRKLEVARYGRLRCDAYERKGRNLIEAKGSTGREFIRMAVGQLLDYAFQAKANPQLRIKHKAILIPQKPSVDILKWLASLGIHVIWPNKRVFLSTSALFSTD